MGSGKPTQRVVANHGDRSDLDIESIRTALKAWRAAYSVVLTEFAAAAGSRVRAPGIAKVDEQLYVLDLGISTRSFRVTSECPAVEVIPETLEGGRFGSTTLAPIVATMAA